MKKLLTITTLLEGATGLALAIVPASVISMLLGASLTDPSVMLVSRIAGGILMAIAVACWLSRNSARASAMVTLMLGYNIVSTLLLVYAGIVKGSSGPGLWPAVLIHLALLIWCIASLGKRVEKFN